MIKVLYIGKFAKKTATEHIVSRALASAGCSVIEVDYTLKDAPKRIQSVCAKKAPDVALFSKATGIDMSLIKGIQAKKVMWLFDGIHTTDMWKLRDDGPSMIDRANLMDAVFTAAKSDLGVYRDAGCRRVSWLPQGVDEAHNKYIPRERAEDAVFIGNKYGSYRSRFLSGVRDFGSKVSIYGSLWDIESNAAVPMLDVSNVYAGAKCAIGMGEIEPAAIDQFSCRVWHVMGSRCVLLHQRLPSLETLFKDGEHLFFWENERECHDLIQRMKSDPETRERVALNAYREVCEKHLYKHRVGVMLDTIKEMK